MNKKSSFNNIAVNIKLFYRSNDDNFETQSRIMPNENALKSNILRLRPPKIIDILSNFKDTSL